MSFRIVRNSLRCCHKILRIKPSDLNKKGSMCSSCIGNDSHGLHDSPRPTISKVIVRDMSGRDYLEGTPRDQTLMWAWTPLSTIADRIFDGSLRSGRIIINSTTMTNKELKHADSIIFWKAGKDYEDM